MSRRFQAAVLTSVALFFIGATSVDAQSAPKTLDLETIFGDALSVSKPSQIRWVDSDRLSYRFKAEAESSNHAGDEGDEVKKDGSALWLMDLATGEKTRLIDAKALSENVPKAEIDERERTRRSRFRVPPYLFSPDTGRVLFTTTGQLVLYTVKSQEWTILAPTKHGVLDPKFSPDGQSIAFVYQHDIWSVPIEGGEERQLTHGGHELLLHGDLDWVYPEELGVRSGYHFSPDGQYIAFLEMDESSVPTYPITEKVSWQATVDLQRYPKPGDPSPRVRVGIVHLESGRTAWLDRAAEYIPRIDWADDRHVAVQLLNRGQDELELVLADPATGRSRSVLMETDEHWVDVTDDLIFLADGEHFLWTSHRSGLRHIYLYNRQGQLVRQLTDGDFRVGGIQGLDETGGWVYYTANADNLLGGDFYRVRLDGSATERLTEGKGTHSIQMNPAATAWMDSYSSLDVDVVPRRTAHHIPSGKVIELYRDFDLSAYGLVQPELLELKADDGALVRMMLMKPKKLRRGKKHPVLIYVYGMAGVPTIRDSRRGTNRFLFHQFLVQQGYFVAHVDDRSSSIPGHKYAVTADHNLGPVATQDAAVAVAHLRSLPYVDPDRLAVWGWSGGGFTTAYLLGHTDFFKAGIAGAPVTDWRLYDSIYTERYMGTPAENPEAYERTSAINGAADLSGRLLLIHGTHDDNVHPQNTLKMMDELIKARKQFDLMMYPNKTHGITGDDHNFHLYTLMFEFLERHL